MPLCLTSQTQAWVQEVGLVPLSQGDSLEKLPMHGVGKGAVPGLAASRTWPGKRAISWLRLNLRGTTDGGAPAASVPATGRKTQQGLWGPELAQDLQQCPPREYGKRGRNSSK